ncbi:hypothetical protein [Marinobacter caseinilyticus]|uniref:hypothetical protein n=1 Tax=Marinobacter caseinilyticus TaxID=2692195 RepID=UPI00140A514D|nr:hypothetical protein [Marinobacter caseinilyticus]
MLRQQALFSLAELRRTAEQFEAAGRILAKMDPGYWAALGYLNLASEYSRIDRDPARALVALRVAEAMIGADDDHARASDLTALIRLKAGVLSYQRSEYDKAIGFLKTINLDSYQAPQALYFHGLALAGQQNYRAAMQSWHRAKKYPLAYPGVVDAWLGMGRGYDESGYLGQAGEAYQAANSAFESERVSLRLLIRKVEASGAYDALVRAARHEDVEWFLADSRTLTQPRVAYLLHYMEGADAQVAVNRVAELVSLDSALAHKEQDLAVYIAMLRQRQAKMTAGVGTSGRASVEAGIAPLAQRLKVLKASAAANSGQTEQLTRIYQSLLDTKRRVGVFDRLAAKAPKQFAQLLRRAVAAQSAVKDQRQVLSELQGRAETILTEEVIAFLKQQHERITFALDRTEQQIAHLYEHLALTGLKRGEQK